MSSPGSPLTTAAARCGCEPARGQIHPSSAGLPLESVEFVEAIATRVVELLDERHQAAAQDRSLLTPAELAEELGVERGWVYDHQRELGVIRLGDGPKPRLRFDLEAAKSAMSRWADGRSQAQIASDDRRSEQPAPQRSRRLPNGLPKTGSVLTIRGGR